MNLKYNRIYYYLSDFIINNKKQIFKKFSYIIILFIIYGGARNISLESK